MNVRGRVIVGVFLGEIFDDIFRRQSAEGPSHTGAAIGLPDAGMTCGTELRTAPGLRIRGKTGESKQSWQGGPAGRSHGQFYARKEKKATRGLPA